MALYGREHVAPGTWKVRLVRPARSGLARAGAVRAVLGFECRR